MGSEGGPHTPSFLENCSGPLLALLDGRWVNVILTLQSKETKKNMAQLCNGIGCGGDFAKNGTAFRNTCLSNCTIINSNLYNCTETEPGSCSSVTQLVCAKQAVRLIGGSDRCAGRVELFAPEGWGSVCGDGWNEKGGHVVCAQLGCGTASLAVGKAGMFDLGSGPIYISKLNCSGTESNLWQCPIELDKGRNLCGHKEDAVVVCSESSFILTTTMNTLMPNFTNGTTETVTEIAAEDSRSGISPPIIGCIVLSIALLLLLFSNAAQCAFYKIQNGGTEARRASQASQRDNSDTSSDSDYERYHIPEPPPSTAVNNHNTLRVGDCNQEQGSIFEERSAVQCHAHDSDSTSSGECYERIETENLLNPDVNQFYPGQCIQMTPLQNISKPAKTEDSFDSDSTSSGECYENTEVNVEPCLQTREGDQLLPGQPPLSHPKPQMAGNSSVSQPHSPVQDVTQFSPEHHVQMTPFHNGCKPAQIDSADSFDSDSTSSGECYENIETNPELCLQPLEGDPSLPEQPPLSQPKPQLAGNSSVSQPYSPHQDDESTSSEDAYENVAEIEDTGSSDNDYDDVANW
ncbi:T-cell differentiation antigen CD6-like isoform X2 [Clarias magur]|uniref:T-cell differentiation antigen CD6-like isoform X2 n=1 Tax=Clarias magur TaxID=1594786 RepID=A0A8J4X8K6_CLAMG|nr:T-cell differentiation antigen CD6-like isoform X2 [Clarias magur]